MGDMADLAIQQGMDEWLAHLSGDCDTQDPCQVCNDPDLGDRMPPRVVNPGDELGPKKKTGGKMVLPSSKQKGYIDPDQVTGLLYSVPKAGKTTWLSSFPDALFLMTEPGAKGLDIWSFNHEGGGVTDWDIFRSAVQLLAEDPGGRFKTVHIDTAERAYDMCQACVCRENSITHPQDLPYGKGWSLVRQEFTNQIYRLLQSGRGVWFTSHVTESGENRDKIRPSLSGQAMGVIEALVDCYFFADNLEDEDGNNVRVIITEGNKNVWAGHRAIPGVESLPTFMPLTREGGYDLLRRAFRGEDVGLHPKTLVPMTKFKGVKKLVISKTKEAEKNQIRKPSKKTKKKGRSA